MDKKKGFDIIKHPLLASCRTGFCYCSLKSTDSRGVTVKLCRLETVRDEELVDGAWIEGCLERGKYYA